MDGSKQWRWGRGPRCAHDRSAARSHGMGPVWGRPSTLPFVMLRPADGCGM
jgi:hypothetical protein